MIFGRHDLISDAPISRVDLLVCRNALMYFSAEAQAKILIRFHFALGDGGFLFLGKAETLLSHTNLFTPVDIERRLFARVPRVNIRDRLLAFSNDGADEASAFSGDVRVREAAFDTSPVAQIVVDAAGVLVMANEAARSLFGLAVGDLSRPLQDLTLSYRPVELRSLIDQAHGSGRVAEFKNVPWSAANGADARVLDVQVTPLNRNVRTAPLGVSISFLDVTHTRRLQLEVERSNQELEAAYEELQSTNEELETTNEELQSTIEELETTNEELQSSNEELETMNEELQSANEQLQSINDEARRRSADLDEVNMLLESILTRLRSGLAILDNQLDVVVWSRQAEEMWGLRAEEAVGRSFLQLDIGLPVAELAGPIIATLSGERDDTSMTLEAVNRRGRVLQCRVTCRSLTAGTGESRGAILLMEAESETAGASH